MRRYLVGLLFMCLFFVSTSFASNKVLIVSSYGSDYKWSNSIINSMTHTLNESFPGVEVNVEFLSSEFIDDTEILSEKIKVLLNNYRKNPPRAIVLISDEAWMAYRAVNLTVFKDVPLVLCAVKPHSISAFDFTHSKDTLSLSHFKPTLELMREYNATGVLREMNVSGFLSLMDNLIDDMDRFVFITDHRFYGVYTRMFLQQEAESKYPNIPVEYIDARFVDTDSLLSILPDIPPTAGLLMTSWLTGEHGFEYSKDYVYSQMENKLSTPIFITNNIGIEKEYFVGGYFNDASFWGNKTAGILIDILRGRNPKKIQPLIFHDDECHIAWKVFKRYDLDEIKLPLKAIFYNQPDSFFVTFKYPIIGVSIVFFIIFVVYLLTLRSNFKLQATQRLLLVAIEETNSANIKLEKTQESLIVALQKAEESDRLKSAFLANMSHEIRTPLNAIVGFSGVIAEMDSKEERMEFLKQIQNNSDLLLQLISDILDISKIEAGMFTLSVDLVDSTDVCSNVIVSLSSRCKPGVTLFLSESACSIPFYTDQNRLMQIILNLTNNAMKFTDKGTIEVGCSSYNDDFIEFYVKDTGIGISEEQLPVIFERFVKLNSYIEGTGLGLPICKTFVEMLGGEIGVKSTLGLGSHFWFRVLKDLREKA